MSTLAIRARLLPSTITIFAGSATFRSSLHTSPILTMSSEYLVHVPDFPGALEKRLASRSEHLKNIMPKVQAGQVVMGGATLSKQPAEGEAPDMTGSVMIIKASSEKEVRELLEADVYTQGGAWDTKNATIWNFRSAVRTAL